MHVEEMMIVGYRYLGLLIVMPLRLIEGERENVCLQDT